MLEWHQRQHVSSWKMGSTSPLSPNKWGFKIHDKCPEKASTCMKCDRPNCYVLLVDQSQCWTAIELRLLIIKMFPKQNECHRMFFSFPRGIWAFCFCLWSCFQIIRKLKRAKAKGSEEYANISTTFVHLLTLFAGVLCGTIEAFVFWCRSFCLFV